jgi:hypothetical protein
VHTIAKTNFFIALFDFFWNATLLITSPSPLTETLPQLLLFFTGVLFGLKAKEKNETASCSVNEYKN